MITAKFVLMDEQIVIVEPLGKRLSELNDDGKIGIALAQLDWKKDGTVIVYCGLVEDEKAKAVIFANGGTQEVIDATFKRLEKRNSRKVELT